MNKAYDYDDVRVQVNDDYVSYEHPEAPDLSFQMGDLKSELPIVLYYDASEGDSRMERICEKFGVLTAGASGSKIQLPQGGLEEIVNGKEPPGFRLFEAFAPLSGPNQEALKKLREEGNKILATVVVSSEHARALANELRLVDAILVGQTSPQVAHRLESTGMSVPRVSLIREVEGTVDVPVIATASSPADICKALVAGADAALIHFGGPFDDANDSDLEFSVKAIVDAIRENLVELCLASGAKNVRELSTRCKLTPA